MRGCPRVYNPSCLPIYTILQDCLYHHPVHKISFIAQDMTDSRAFGYIYGSPENGHRFFGIKTEKAAGAVVVSMRDLFQVVFELKKKEMDEAKRQLGRDKEVREYVCTKCRNGKKQI